MVLSSRMGRWNCLHPVIDPPTLIPRFFFVSFFYIFYCIVVNISYQLKRNTNILLVCHTFVFVVLFIQYLWEILVTLETTEILLELLLS